MNNLLKEFVAEFLGTTIFMLSGLSGSATKVLSGNSSSAYMPAISYAAGSVVASFFCGPISGAHINPAITLARCTIGRCRWRRCPVYMFAQYLGSFLASAIIYGLYCESIQALDASPPPQVHPSLTPNNTTTGHNTAIVVSIFTASPAPHISLVPAIGDQVVSTAMLAFAGLFIAESVALTKSPSPSGPSQPKAIQILANGFTLFASVVSFNYNCGAILNPARDLPPRLFLAVIGYHRTVFSALDGHFWWAVGVLGPHLGAILGSVLYLLMSRMRSSIVIDKVDSSSQVHLDHQCALAIARVSHLSNNISSMIAQQSHELIYLKGSGSVLTLAPSQPTATAPESLHL